MKEIKLKYRDLYLIVDDEDFNKVCSYPLWLKLDKNRLPAAVTTNINGKRIYIHELIVGKVPGKVIDHINHNKLDYRKESLRFCSNAENLRNRRKFSIRGLSKYKGVTKSSKSRWRAQITFNKNPMTLGYFNDELAAARAYNEKAKELFGEFAHLNIIP